MVTHTSLRLLRLLAAAAVGGLFVAGVFLHGVTAGVLLLGVAALLLLLTSTVWAGLHPRGRAVRVVVLAAVMALALGKLLTA